MTINIQKCSNVTVVGHHSGRNTKAVYNITTGAIYASVLDAADAIGVTQGAVSYALDDNHKRKCKGMRFCFLSKVMEHFEEITEQNRIRAERDRINTEKIAAYDAIIAKERAQREREEAERRRKVEAETRRAKHEAKCEELRARLEKEMKLLYEAEEACK